MLEIVAMGHSVVKHHENSKNVCLNNKGSFKQTRLES